MNATTYHHRRAEIETYFDRTALDAWIKLTSDAPLGRIRATVRAGRDAMRSTLLSWLPADLSGLRILDAGCGTGVLAREAAARGAEVVAVDISPGLIQMARERAHELRDHPATGTGAAGVVHYEVGDFTDPALGRFDHVVAMDSLIHYRTPDVVASLARLAQRCEGSMVFTFAPRTPALAVMHAVGRWFPRADRAPAIEPVAPARLHHLIRTDTALASWRIGRERRVVSGFYLSQALELTR